MFFCFYKVYAIDARLGGTADSLRYFTKNPEFDLKTILLGECRLKDGAL